MTLRPKKLLDPMCACWPPQWKRYTYSTEKTYRPLRPVHRSPRAS